MLRPRQLVVAVAGGVILAIHSGVSARAAETPRAAEVPRAGIFSGGYTLSGTVKEIDTVGRRIIVHDAKTGQDVAFAVTPQTSIQCGAISRIELERIKPGSDVAIRDAAFATNISIRGQILGTVKSVSPVSKIIVLEEEGSGKDVELPLLGKFELIRGKQRASSLIGLKVGSHVILMPDSATTRIIVESEPESMIEEFTANFRHNLFKPLLLFFFLGFLVPILRVKFEFPYVIYQGLTIFLLIAIGWHGGEELALLKPRELAGAGGFMVVGFLLNFCIGILAYLGLSALTTMRRIDKATVAGYYGSDSAGTFVTCLGVLATARITYAAYMPVMLAVMEIPGCLVALYLVSRLRHRGMDPRGNMPDEPGYDPNARPILPLVSHRGEEHGPVEDEEEMALEKMVHEEEEKPWRNGILSPAMLHEVFLNPGLYLLFGGVAVGFIGGLQGPGITRDADEFFVRLFQGVLCLFLLEMGMTASRKLKDLRTAGPGFIAFGLIAPNVFATIGILVAHTYAWATGAHFQLGTYVLFSVLCAAASYIAVPAVQRLAIPEASPTLPLAASLGLTFSYNVTLGIPIYIEIAKLVMRMWPT
jgi:uncharacterized protein